MIFYFSGTGNSLWIAKELGEKWNDKLISISNELNKTTDKLEYELQSDEKLVFVFPVHSWGPAVLVLRFIEKMILKNYTNQKIYSICVCGDNCGYTDKVLSQALKKRSFNLTETFSIQMPNNYILMKGFGIDPENIEKSKLDAAPHLLQEIIDSIQRKDKKEHYTAGQFPFFKTHIVYPLFKKYVIGKNSFFATDKCISCGLCVSICPTNTIAMEKNQKPVWNKTCVQCTACIHRCPVRAIEYGKITQSQGRYCHPDLR